MVPERLAPADPHLVGLTPRLAAGLIDSAVILTVSCALLCMVLGVPLLGDTAGGPFIGVRKATVLLVALTYFTVLESAPGQTSFGKWLLGLRLESCTSAERIDWRVAFLRSTLKVMTVTLTLGGGLITIALTPRAQAPHDLLLGTLVRRVAPAPARSMKAA